MKAEIKNLVELSCKIGIFQEFVQGGGGNTSVKLGDDLMAIKASGFFLKQMKEDDGFAIVNYNKIKQYIQNENILTATEEILTKCINEASLFQEGFPYLRPSIETGFHAILPAKYVIHTHSVYANILCCSTEGRSLAHMLFPDAVWVPYANPGKGITFEINSLTSGEEIIFMQNHGIIITSETVEGAYNLHEFVNKKIIEFLNIKEEYKTYNPSVDIEFLKENVIFPDQVVYLLSEELQNTLAGVETLNACNFVVNKIRELGFNLNLISKQDINYIKNMESEKYRQSLIKK